MNYKKIVEDAIKYEYLVEACLGCGLPYSTHFTPHCNDCPAGSKLIWNPDIKKLLKRIKKEEPQKNKKGK